MAVAAILAGIFGTIVGSFLNVVVHRLPRDEPLGLLRKSRSACPRCGALIRWYDNIPLLSYLVLAGRCRSCKGSISWRYPLVEAVTGLLFAWAACVVLARGLAPPVWAFLLVGGFLALLVAAAAIDLQHRILPDALTLRAGPVIALAATLTVPDLHGTSILGIGIGEGLKPGLASLLVGLAGLIAGGGAILLVRALGTRLLRREAMGLGDAKLMATCGLLLGPGDVLLAIGLAIVTGAVSGLLVWAATREREIPFGPFLALGSALMLLAGEPVRRFLFETYPSWFGAGVVSGPWTLG